VIGFERSLSSWDSVCCRSALEGSGVCEDLGTCMRIAGVRGSSEASCTCKRLILIQDDCKASGSSCAVPVPVPPQTLINFWNSVPFETKFIGLR
jgi:hypothetical protein